MTALLLHHLSYLNNVELLFFDTIYVRDSRLQRSLANHPVYLPREAVSIWGNCVFVSSKGNRTESRRKYSNFGRWQLITPMVRETFESSYISTYYSGSMSEITRTTCVRELAMVSRVKVIYYRFTLINATMSHRRHVTSFIVRKENAMFDMPFRVTKCHALWCITHWEHSDSRHSGKLKQIVWDLFSHKRLEIAFASSDRFHQSYANKYDRKACDIVIQKYL